MKIRRRKKLNNRKSVDTDSKGTTRTTKVNFKKKQEDGQRKSKLDHYKAMREMITEDRFDD